VPIDFNPQVINNIQPQIVNQQYVVKNKPTKDVFVKSIDKNYEGIKITKKSFGKIKKTSEIAELYTITNKNGASVSLSTFGATITGIKVPDKNGKLVDVTQGYNNVTPYEIAPVGHAGGTIGPCANKIYEGKFKIGDNEYQLECNKDGGKTHSHGGSEGLDLKNWKARKLSDGIEFTYYKKDMEMGYPGNVEAKVTYKFDNENRLHIIYNAKTDKDTLVNMTNHTYFNLEGAENTDEGAVLDHSVELPNSSKITENNHYAIPTGKMLDVKGTPFDFLSSKKIGESIDSENEQLKIGKGYDQNYCIDNYDGKSLIEVAKVEAPKSGIVLKVSTNLPGFQFYTANNLGKPTQPAGKDGKRYEKRSAFCIEPQFYPNAINTESFKEKGILKAGEVYNKEIVYSFDVNK